MKILIVGRWKTKKKKKNQWERTTAFSESEREREEVEMEMRRKRIGKKGMGILSGKNAAFYLSFVVGIDNSNFYVQALGILNWVKY